MTEPRLGGRGGGMTLKEIVTKWLKENGYDGLCEVMTECGCGLDDLMPCGEPKEDCEAGHEVKAPKDSNVDYFIYPGKGKNNDRTKQN